MQTALLGPAAAHWVSGDEFAFAAYENRQLSVLPVVSRSLPHNQVGAKHSDQHSSELANCLFAPVQ